MRLKKKKKKRSKETGRRNQGEKEKEIKQKKKTLVEYTSLGPEATFTITQVCRFTVTTFILLFSIKKPTAVKHHSPKFPPIAARNILLPSFLPHTLGPSPSQRT